MTFEETQTLRMTLLSDMAEAVAEKAYAHRASEREQTAIALEDVAVAFNDMARKAERVLAAQRDQYLK